MIESQTRLIIIMETSNQNEFIQSIFSNFIHNIHESQTSIKQLVIIINKFKS